MTGNLPAIARQQNAAGATFWALLIGIDLYLSPDIPPLHGAKNDIRAMQALLTSRYGVEEAHICSLTDAEATRAAILSTLHAFLIENAAIRACDQILIQFCGHGSRRANLSGIEPDGYDETIVPYDGRMPGIFDIPDKTLAALLTQLVERTQAHVTVLLDCCHSGSGLRTLPMPGAAQFRQILPDDRAAPAELDADILGTVGTQSAAVQSWQFPAASTPNVLLAACRDRELASELCRVTVRGEELWYGAFSYFTVQCLRQLPADATYADLRERVAAQVNVLYPNQMPQCEGDRDRIVFSGAHYLRTPLFTAQAGEHNVVQIDGGYIHGLRRGTELAVYPPFTHNLDEASSKPLASVQVTEVSATSALAHVLSSNVQTIPPHSKCAVSRQSYSALRQRVFLEFSPDSEAEADLLVPKGAKAIVLDELAKQIRGEAQERFPSPFLEIVSDPSVGADLYVIATPAGLCIRGANGDMLVRHGVFSEDTEHSMALDKAKAAACLQALERIAVYRSVIALINDDPLSGLAGKIHVRLRHYQPDTPGSQLTPVSLTRGGGLTVSVDPKDRTRNRYVVEIANGADKLVYPHVFALSPDFSIVRLYPRHHQEEALIANKTMYLGLDSPTERLAFYLPPGWTSSQDYLKVIITRDPTDLSLLEQSGVQSPTLRRTPRRSAVKLSLAATALEALLETLMTGNEIRFMPTSRDLGRDDWTTVELPITALTKSETV